MLSSIFNLYKNIRMYIKSIFSNNYDSDEPYYSSDEDSYSSFDTANGY